MTQETYVGTYFLPDAQSKKEFDIALKFIESVNELLIETGGSKLHTKIVGTYNGTELYVYK